MKFILFLFLFSTGVGEGPSMVSAEFNSYEACSAAYVEAQKVMKLERRGVSEVWGFCAAKGAEK